MADADQKIDLGAQFAAGQVLPFRQSEDRLIGRLEAHRPKATTDQELVALIEEWANQGDLYAAATMARLTRGEGTGFDDLDWEVADEDSYLNPDDTFKWASIAAQSGSGWDFGFLAVCYFNGTGVARDPKRALELLLQAGAALTLFDPKYTLESLFGDYLQNCIKEMAGSLVNGVTIQPAATPAPKQAIGNAPAQGG